MFITKIFLTFKALRQLKKDFKDLDEAITQAVCNKSYKHLEPAKAKEQLDGQVTSLLNMQKQFTLLANKLEQVPEPKIWEIPLFDKCFVSTLASLLEIRSQLAINNFKYEGYSWLSAKLARELK